MIARDTSFLTKLPQKFNPVVKDRLFYNLYEYSINFRLNEVSCLRELNHDYIDKMIDRRKGWREIAEQRWHKSKHIIGTSLARRHNNITDQTIGNLHTLANILLDTTVEFKLVVSVDQARVYTNSSRLINQLDQLPCLIDKNYSRAQISRPKNTIKLKNCKHQYRSYFKLTKLTTEGKHALVNFFTNQQGHIRLSPSLTTWIDGSFHRTQDYFFIDHDSESWLTMLCLVHPGLIRKTLQIIAAK